MDKTLLLYLDNFGNYNEYFSFVSSSYYAYWTCHSDITMFSFLRLDFIKQFLFKGVAHFRKCDNTEASVHRDPYQYGVIRLAHDQLQLKVSRRRIHFPNCFRSTNLSRWVQKPRGARLRRRKAKDLRRNRHITLLVALPPPHRPPPRIHRHSVLTRFRGEGGQSHQDLVAIGQLASDMSHVAVLRMPSMLLPPRYGCVQNVVDLLGSKPISHTATFQNPLIPIA